MFEWWKLALGTATVLWPIVAHSISITREQVKQDRLKGCTCRHPYWGMIDWDCPVHHSFYLLHNATKIYISYGEKTPVCATCFNEVAPDGYTVNFPIENNICHLCGYVKETMEIPKRDLKLWKTN